MTNITQTPDSYPEGVYQLAVTDPVLGGPEGFSNKAPIDLANRTNYQRMRNVTPWRPGVDNPYPAHAYVQHAGVTWKSLVANANVEPGTDATKWIRWAFTLTELMAILDAYALDSDLNNYVASAALGGLVSTLTNGFIGPDPTKQRVFTPNLVLSDMPAVGTPYTLQTLTFTGARRARINAHAAFRSDAGASSVNVSLSLLLNGSGTPFGGHYLGAALPYGSTTQIPISISDTLFGLNPATTYTVTIRGQKASAVGPIAVQDAYIDVEYV